MTPIPPGVLGTRADLIMDGIIVVVALVPLLLLISWRLAARGSLRSHRAMQLVLSVAFVLVLGVFEPYIRVRGGLEGISVGSTYHGSGFLWAYLAVHLSLALSSTLSWGALVVASIRRFPNPPVRGAFSARHRLWGRLTMAGMALTAITGLGLYALCFIA
jgi:uncharacterized membrane protein YozB (DUF420 family)